MVRSHLVKIRPPAFNSLKDTLSDCDYVVCDSDSCVEGEWWYKPRFLEELMYGKRPHTRGAVLRIVWLEAWAKIGRM